MPITYPYDFLSTFPGWTTEFDLFYRQEQSRTSGGVTYVKDLGSPLWAATWQSRSMSPNELDAWRARLKAMENGLKQFVAQPKSRCYPIAYPGGAGMGDVSAVTIGSIASDRKTVTLDGLPVGYTRSVGDYIQVGATDLHQIVFVDGLDTELRPHLWPGAVAGAAVTLVKPTCLMTIVPGSISTTADGQTGRGVVTFQGIESRNAA